MLLLTLKHCNGRQRRHEGAQVVVNLNGIDGAAKGLAGAEASGCGAVEAVC